MLTKDRELAVSLIDKYLTYLGCANSPLGEFDGSYLLTSDSASSLDSDNPVSYTGAEPCDFPSCQWSVRLLGDHRIGGLIGRGEFMLSSFRSVHWSEYHKTKGLSEAAGRHDFDALGEHRQCTVMPDGSVERDRQFVGYKSGKWRYVFDPGARVFGSGVLGFRGRVEHEDCLKVMLGIAYLEPTFWVARVRMDGSPAVSLITDPTGVKELWRLRDAPPGTNRRAALLHWVSCHWRELRHDPDCETYVRTHLRGARKFTQGAFQVEVHESSEDRVAILRAIHDRERMRHHPRKDRRRTNA